MSSSEIQNDITVSSHPSGETESALDEQNANMNVSTSTRSETVAQEPSDTTSEPVRMNPDESNLNVATSDAHNNHIDQSTDTAAVSDKNDIENHDETQEVSTHSNVEVQQRSHDEGFVSTHTTESASSPETHEIKERNINETHADDTDANSSDLSVQHHDNIKQPSKSPQETDTKSDTPLDFNTNTINKVDISQNDIDSNMTCSPSDVVQKETSQECTTDESTEQHPPSVTFTSDSMIEDKDVTLEPISSNNNQAIQKATEERFNEAELYLRNEIIHHWKLGGYSVALARRGPSEHSTNDFDFVARCSQPTKSSPVAPSFVSIRLHVNRTPDNVWHISGQVELETFIYSQQQLRENIVWIIERAQRNKIVQDIDGIDLIESFERTRCSTEHV